MITMYIIRPATDAFPFYTYETASEFMREGDTLECVVVDDPSEIEKYL